MKFVLAQDIIGQFSANGVIGLGPKLNEYSIVRNLLRAGQMAEKKVGFNFENPKDVDSVSTISWGWFDTTQVHGGEAGLNWYDNIGEDGWGI